MWDFLKKIFSNRDGEVTVLVLDESDPDMSSSFNLRAFDIVKVALVVVIISVLLTTLIFFITPLGSLYQYSQESELRSNVIEISEKVVALQDSLNARDRQLTDLKEVLIENRDTTFNTRFAYEPIVSEGTGMTPINAGTGEPHAFEMLSQNEIIFSNILRNTPDFPTSFPVDGTVSQEFSPEEGHYGIDVAAREQSEFRSVADGTVVNAGWSMNYGYVIYVQHSGGYISVYKHGAKLLKKEGDIVLKGDILGTVGDKGVLSFGSHLHFELWKNGVAQNPLMYLIN